MVSRNTLIKAVLSTYPLFAMQTALLPISVLKDIEKSCKKFLSNKVDSTHYIPRTSWSIFRYEKLQTLEYSFYS